MGMNGSSRAPTPIAPAPAPHHRVGGEGLVQVHVYDVKARVAASVVMRADHRHTRELALGTGYRREADALHARDLLEDLLKIIQTAHEPLT
jgi:hypothetical protein